jgi:hypothetical protein
MNDISVIAMFCSDVRQEMGGTQTIVGVFPDSVNLSAIPGAFAQMHVYVRMHIRPSFRPSSIVTRLVLPDGAEEISEMDMKLIETARGKAIASGATYMGLLATFALAPMHIKQEGRLQAIVSVDGVDHVAGALYCKQAPQQAAAQAT